MARIILINPPFLKNFSRTQRSPGVTKSGTIYYPYWLCYAAGVLDKEGHEVRIVDASPVEMSLEGLKKIVRDFYPDMAVVDTSTPSIKNDCFVARELKTSIPGMVVALVGTHVSAVPEETLALEPAVDVVAVGEYDAVLKELAGQLKDRSGWPGVKGICFRQDGKIVRNPPGPLLADLDELPFVSEIYKKFLNVRDYYFSAADYPMIMMITGRGCPFGCFYCLYPQVMHGRGYRFRSAENVAAEFKYIAENFPDVKEIVIEDDTFTANPARVRAICELLIKDSSKIKWSCNARVNLDLATLKLMKKAGCRLLIVGYESGVQEILDSMHKGIKVEQSEEFTRNAKKAGILIHGCFMLGNPGETRDTIEKTFKFAKKLQCDSAQFYPLFVYPGTEAYDWAKGNGYISAVDFSEWISPDGRHNCVIDIPGLKGSDITDVSERMTLGYHLRPRYVMYKLTQLFSNTPEFIRTVRSGVKYFALLVKLMILKR